LTELQFFLKLTTKSFLKVLNNLCDTHVHIVTTNIKADGKRIELHNLGKNQSEKARKEIEIHYGLVKAEDMKKQPYVLKAIPLQKNRNYCNSIRKAARNRKWSKERKTGYPFKSKD